MASVLPPNLGECLATARVVRPGLGLPHTPGEAFAGRIRAPDKIRLQMLSPLHDIADGACRDDDTGRDASARSCGLALAGSLHVGPSFPKISPVDQCLWLIYGFSFVVVRRSFMLD